MSSSKIVRKSTSFLLKSALAIAILAIPALAADNYTYLALGESIAFGYTPLLFAPGLPTPTPSEFVGYPEIIAQIVPQYANVANAGCPGETSASFLNEAAPDNGCNHDPQPGVPPFKFSIGLHVPYLQAQMDFATSELTSDKKISLVTLSIGGNELLLLQQRCATAASFQTCVLQGLPAVLSQYGANLTQILIKIRQNYSGTIVVVNNYVPNTDPTYITAVAALDVVTDAVALAHGAKIADAFTAFQIASAMHRSKTFPFAGDPCAAGLLVRLSATTCDVHPTLAGQQLIASTVLATLNPFNPHH